MKVIRRSKSVATIIPPTLLSIGFYDIDYSITLNDDDIKKFKIEDVSALSTYQDFEFILENKYLWNKIQIDTVNKNINLLLYMNKVGTESNKAYVEYIAYEQPVFLNNKVELMIKTVNDFNFFFVNSTPLFSDKKKHFSLKVIYKDQEATFNLSEEQSDNNENNEKKNENDVQNNEQNQNDENKEKTENEENKNNGENNKKNFLKNKDNIFNRINLDCEQYNFFICTIQDSVSIENYQDFIEFLTYMKLNFGALIAIEYNNFCSYFPDKDSMTLLNRIYLLTDIFLFDNKDTIANFKKHYETFEMDKEKKTCDSEEKKTENQSKENEYSEEQKITDGTLKEENKLEKENNKSTNQLENKKTSRNVSKINIRNKNKSKFENNEKELFDYFKRKIACNGALSILNTKLGIFIDNNFSKITFIEVPMNTRALILSYDIKPYPKLSHTTVDLVDFYKTTLKQNREYYKSIFYGGLFHKIIQSKKKNFGLEILYPSYLTGHEILKRILNINIKNIPLPENPKFYTVKLNLNEIKDYIQQSYLDKKESRFVLDCTNLESSKLKNYVPLFDGNLHEFFENKVVKRDLIQKGFVNSKGFVNYDPVYRKGMGVPKIKYNKSSSIIDQNYIKKQVDANVKNLKMRVLIGNQATNVKLPIIQCKVTEKINNYNKRVKKCVHKNYDKKCKYCILAQKAIIEHDIEMQKKKKMQLRSYDTNI